jgi:2-iminobutanoate/2-iminopropanoate deaminase
MRKQWAGVVLGVFLLAAGVMAADKQVVRPPGAQPSGNWSHGLLVDGTLYVSGMAGEDAQGKVPPTFEAEMKQALDNIDAVLKAGGMTSANVVSAQVYLTDVTLFDRMNKVYTSYFKDPRPTRTTVVVSRLVGDGHVEITVTARK